jgi:hypothetical protein
MIARRHLWVLFISIFVFMVSACGDSSSTTVGQDADTGEAQTGTGDDAGPADGDAAVETGDDDDGTIGDEDDTTTGGEDDTTTGGDDDAATGGDDDATGGDDDATAGDDDATAGDDDVEDGPDGELAVSACMPSDADDSCAVIEALAVEDLAPGAAFSWTIRVENVGDVSATFNSAAFGTENYSAAPSGDVELPAVLLPGESLDLTLGVNPGLGPGALPADTLSLSFSSEGFVDLNLSLELSGMVSDCDAGYGWESSASGCTDVDECPSEPCTENSVCENTVGAYTCTCAAGYEAEDDACVDIDECATQNGGCHANADCTNEAGSFSCACKDGYMGDGVTDCGATPTDVYTELSTDTVMAGETFTVTCVFKDAMGEQAGVVDDVDVYVSAPDEEINDLGAGVFEVIITMADTFEVKCKGTGVEQHAVEITVTPGLPYSWTVDWKTGDCLDMDDGLDLDAEVIDIFDNVLENPSIEITTEPSGFLVATGEDMAETMGACSSDGAACQDASSCPDAVPTCDGYMAAVPAVDGVMGTCSNDNSIPCMEAAACGDTDATCDGYVAAAAFVDEVMGACSEASAECVDASTCTDLASTCEGYMPAAFVADGDYAWAAEGEGDVTVTLTGETHPEVTFEAVTSHFIVDESAPELLMTSPQRAEMLVVADGGYDLYTIQLEGTVTDAASNLVSLSVNDVEIELPVEGTMSQAFSVPHESRWGVNIIKVTALDACGHTTFVQQSYMRSPSYFPATTDDVPEGRAPQSFMIRLNQDVMDDGDRNDIDDLATLASAAMGDVDINASLPNVFAQNGNTDATGEIECGTCVFDWDCWDAETKETGYKATKNGALTHNAPTIDYVNAVDGGIHMKLSIENMKLPLHVYAVFDLGSAAGCTTALATGKAYTDNSLSGDIEVDAVRVEATVNLALSEGQVSASMGNVSVQLENLEVDIDLGLLDFMGGLVDGLVNTVLTTFEGDIEEAIEDAIADEIAPIFGDVLNDISVANTVSLPDPFNFDIELKSGLDHLQFSGPEGSGFGEIGLYSQFYPTSKGATIPDNPEGAIRWDAPDPGFTTDGYTFGIGLADNLINQALWAAWYGGALSLTGDAATEFIPLDFDGASASLEFMTPPVMMPGLGANEIEFGLGDIRIEASVPLLTLGIVDVVAYVSAYMGGSFDIDSQNNEVLVTLDENPEIFLQVDIADDTAGGELSLFLEEMVASAVPDLVGTVLSSIPLPSFDVGGAPGVPEGTVWSLTDGSIERGQGYYRITGSLQ